MFCVSLSRYLKKKRHCFLQSRDQLLLWTLVLSGTWVPTVPWRTSPVLVDTPATSLRQKNGVMIHCVRSFTKLTHTSLSKSVFQQTRYWALLLSPITLTFPTPSCRLREFLKGRVPPSTILSVAGQVHAYQSHQEQEVKANALSCICMCSIKGRTFYLDSSSLYTKMLLRDAASSTTAVGIDVSKRRCMKF